MAKKPIVEASTRPAIAPAPRPQILAPIANVAATVAIEERTAGSAAVHSVTSPPGSDATATDQKKSWGLLRYGTPRRSGMSQRPVSRMSRARSI